MNPKNFLSEKNFISLAIVFATLIISFRNWIYTPSSIIFIALFSIALSAYFLLKQKFNSRLNLILAPFLIFSILSLIYSSTQNVGLPEITLELSLFTLLIGLSAQKLPPLQTILAPTILLQFYYATNQFLTSQTPRAAGTFTNWSSHTDLFPNALGLFAISLIPILAHKKTTPLNAILLTTTTTTLLLSYSRGATLSLAAALIFLTAIHIHRKQFKKILKNTLCIIAAILTFTILTQVRIVNDLPTNDIATKATFSNTEQTTSINERQQFFKNTWQLVPAKPLLGYGPTSYSYIFPQVQEIPLSNSLHPHNWLLKILVERGVLSLISFILVLIFTFITIIKNFNPNVAYFSSLIAIFIHNSIDFNLNLPLNYFILILILAKIFHSLSAKKNTIPSQLAYFSTILITAITAASLIQTHNYYTNGYYTSDSAIQIENFSKIDYLDSALRLADAYPPKEKYLSIKSLEKHLLQNPFDYFATNKIGNLYLWNNQPEVALPYFVKTIELDPKNFVNPFKSLVQSINQTDPTLLKDHEQKILAFLDEYHWAAELNLHFTAQSNQIDEAIQLCQLLLNNPNATDPEKIASIKSDLENFKTTWATLNQ